METENELFRRMGKNCDEGHCREVVPKGWGEGPWEQEPSRVDFRAFGLPCFVHRAFITGSWCGYVGVPRSNPAFGHHYDSINVSVHGGLTFSDKCHGHLCHPQKGAMWWLGFDTGHYMDYSPRLEATMRELRSLPIPESMKDLEPILKHRKEGDGPANNRGCVTHEEDGTVVLHEHYWTLNEIIKETKDLARQLQTISGHNIKVTKGFDEKNRDKSLKALKRSLNLWKTTRKFGLGSSKFNAKIKGRRTSLD